MPRGFLSSLIYALLGHEKERKPEQNSVPHEAKKAPFPEESSASKEWAPNLISGSAKQRAAGKAESAGHISPLSAAHNNDAHALGKEGVMEMRGIRALLEGIKIKKTLNVSPIFVALLLIILYFTPLFSYVKALLAVIILIVVAAASKLVQKLFPFVVGFDLCLFFTVLAGVAYHPLVGMAVGVFSSSLGSVARGQYDMDKVIVPLLGYITVALLLSMMPFSSIFYIGMASAIIYSIMMSVIFWFLKHHIFQTVTFLITSLGFNYWLFSNYSTAVLTILGAP